MGRSASPVSYGAVVSPFLPDVEKIAAVRRALPATGAGIYLDTATAGPLPAETSAAMAQVAEWDLRTGRAHAAIAEEAEQRMAEARASVAAILAADLDAVALAHGTVDVLGLTLAGLSLEAGDAVVTTTVEAPTTDAALLSLPSRGVEIVAADAADSASDDVILERVRAALSPATRLIVLSHASWSTGRLLPVAGIAALAHERDALVFVDGDRAVGAIRVIPADLAADVYAVSGQRWLLGPEGTGAAWFSPRALDRVRPPGAGAFSHEFDESERPIRPWPDARRFEVASFDRSSVVGLARSCGWLSMYVGLDWIYERGRHLARYLADALKGIDGVEILTRAERLGVVVAFRIGGWRAAQALDELEHRAFVMARAIPGIDAIRASLGFFNTEAELDRLVAAVAELASHGPGDLPPRRVLAMATGGSNPPSSDPSHGAQAPSPGGRQ